MVMVFSGVGSMAGDILSRVKSGKYGIDFMKQIVDKSMVTNTRSSKNKHHHK